ncbi:MAG: hypothetical protein KJ864_04985 [Candidatus Omnitrophica bacterium]|nr:hypothetical protein [Candidatus Omnitrophota bacterium]
MTTKINYTFMMWRVSLREFWAKHKFVKIIKFIFFPMFIAWAIPFLLNISNSPDLRLLTAVNKKNDKHILQLAWENLGGHVESFRVQIYVPEKYKGNIMPESFKDSSTPDIRDWTEYVKVEDKKLPNGKDENWKIYYKDIKKKVFANSPTFDGALILSFSNTEELDFEYSIFAESMAERWGYRKFKRYDGGIVKQVEGTAKTKKNYNWEGFSMMDTFISIFTGKYIR